MFCVNVYNKYKYKLFKKIYNDYFKKNCDKLNKKNIKDSKKYNDIIQNKLKKYYDQYTDNYNIYKKNNDIIYRYVKKQNLIITNENFNKTLENLIIKCSKLNGITFDKNNYDLVFFDIIKNILITYYKNNFFHVKYAILYKKPIKKELNLKYFIDHVRKDILLYDNDTIKQSKYYTILSKELKINAEQTIIRKLALNKLKHDFIYRDIVINIMDKCYNSYKSYMSLKYGGFKPSKPKYLEKEARFIIPFYSKSFKIIDDKVRLCLGRHVSKSYNEICKTNYKLIKTQKFTNKYEDDNKNIIDGSFMYLNIPEKIKEKKIKLIEIVPLYNGYKYKINYIYEDIAKNITINKGEYISVDLGMVNLMTIYDPNNKQYLIKGGEIISINEYFNKKIAERQQIIKIVNNKDTCNYIRNLLVKRHNIINNYFDKIVNMMWNLYKTKEKIIIGYNEGWKNKINMGKENNRKFYEIPFKKLLNKLKEKFKERMVEIGEAYTSKTDSLMLEEIKKNKINKGERIKRGLFSSGIKKLINADLNGAINIMRLYYKKENIKFSKIIGERIYNPKKLNVDRKGALYKPKNMRTV